MWLARHLTNPPNLQFEGQFAKAPDIQIDTAFSAEGNSVKEAVVAPFPSCDCSIDVSSLFVVQGRFSLLLHIEFRVNTHPPQHGLCLACMVIASIEILLL